MKTILLPTDFTEVSEKALEFAIEIAKSTNAKIIVTNSFIMHIMYSTDIPMAVPQKFYDDEEEGATLKLRKICERINENTSAIGRNLTSDYVYKYDIAANEIIKLTTEKEIDLLIMGTTGREHFFGFFESTALEVLAKSNCPMMIVNKNSIFKPFKKVFYALEDLNKDIFTTIKLVTLLNTFEPHYTILHANSESNQQDNKEAKEEEAIILVKSIKEYTNYGQIKHKTIYAKKTSDALIDFLRENEFDLLVLLKLDRNWINKLFHQSLIKHFLESMDKPLLIMHKNHE